MKIFYFIVLLLISFLKIENVKGQDDTIKPRAFFSSEITSTNESPIQLTVTFSEQVKGFDLSDIVISNGSAHHLSPSFYYELSDTIGNSGSGNSQFIRPREIFIGGKNRIFINDSGNDRVQIMDSNDNYVNIINKTTVENQETYKTIIMDADNFGNFYVIRSNYYESQPSNEFKVKMTIYESNGELSSEFEMKNINNVREGPYFLAIDNMQNIYIVKSNNKVEVIDQLGNLLLSFGQSGNNDEEFLLINDIEIDYNGDILILDVIRGIKRFDSNGNYLNTINRDPESFELDSEGNIYALFYSSNGLIKYDKNGNFINRIQAYVGCDPPLENGSRVCREYFFDISKENDIYITEAIEPSSYRRIKYINQYKFDVEPIEEGKVIIFLDENLVEDCSGNGNHKSLNFVISYDLTGPIITITSRSTNRSADPIKVDLMFSEEIYNFTQEDIIINNASILNFNGSSTNYTLDVKPNSDFPPEIIIPAGIAVDEAGNQNIAASPYTYSPPHIVSIDPNITNQNPIMVDLGFNEAVTDFNLDDISIVGGTVSNLNKANANSYSFDISPIQEGLISISIPSSSVFDEYGTGNEALRDFKILYDVTGPTVTISSIDIITTFNETIPIEITFSEPVFNFSVDPIGCLVYANSCFTFEDIDVKWASISNFSRKDGRNDTFLAEVIPDYLGTIEIQIPKGSIADLADNENTASGVKKITYSEAVITDAKDVINSEEIINYWIEDHFLNVRIKNNRHQSEILLSDLSGKVFIKEVYKGNSDFRKNINHLPPALYMLTIKNDDTFKTSKFFINK